jgi:hypothetical protein
VPETIRANATAAPTTITAKTTASQIQKRLLFFAATEHLLRPTSSRSLEKTKQG